MNKKTLTDKITKPLITCVVGLGLVGSASYYLNSTMPSPHHSYRATNEITKFRFAGSPVELSQPHIKTDSYNFTPINDDVPNANFPEYFVHDCADESTAICVTYANTTPTFTQRVHLNNIKNPPQTGLDETISSCYNALPLETQQSVLPHLLVMGEIGRVNGVDYTADEILSPVKVLDSIGHGSKCVGEAIDKYLEFHEDFLERNGYVRI